MSTVIAQPYSTASNGGRKLVRLANGNLYSVVRRADSTDAYIMKSVNGGATWTQFSILAVLNKTITDVALVITNDNILCAIYSHSNTTVTVMRFKDDGTVINPGGNNIDSAQTAVGNVTVAIDPTNGHLHAAWASKNVTYPNVYNIRYARSTNEGSTWSSVAQLSSRVSHESMLNPSIVVSKSVPVILAERSGGSSSAVYRYVLNGSVWLENIIQPFTSYPQYNPSAVVDKNGVIHVAWYATDATDSTKGNIRYSKSIDGGYSWSEVQKITSGNNYFSVTPSITVDKNNKLIIVFHSEKPVGASVQNIYTTTYNGTSWDSVVKLTNATTNSMQWASTLYDPSFAGQFGNTPPMIYMNNETASVEYTGTYTTNNAPTVTLTSPTNNQTLYENDTLNISGDAYDEDKDQSVTVYYQINSEQRKVLATNLSQTQIALSKQLTFKGGKLYDGDTALTSTLADGVAHMLKVWAEDSEKASSAVIERTFYVVPNRAPLLSVDAVVPSGVVDADKFKISGTASDQDANSMVKVTCRINTGNAVEIYSGTGGAWEFELALSQLVVGQNTIVIEVVDNYGAKASKTVTLNKKEVKTPILQSVARYKIEPPKGSAKGVLLFIQRDEELDVKVELSMTLSGEQEQYETLTPVNTASVQQGIVEDTFEHEGLEAKENIILKITPSQTDLSFNHKIHLISGAVD